MKDFGVLIAALFTLAQARPQYNYNPPPQISIPSGSYGGPSGGLVANGGIISGGGSFISGGGGGGTYVSSGNAGGLISGSIGIVGGGGSGGLITGGNTGGLVSGGGLIGGGGVGSIQKHIYVHVAPPEPEEIRPHQQVNLGQATKHYKIIFIKAPSPPSYIPPAIAAQLQNQEKTLIYVLVKRPDDILDVSIPSVAPTKPSKPEVYFIRYKARKGASAGGGGSVITTGGGGGGSIITGGSGIGTVVGGGTNVIGGGGTNVISSGGGTGVGVTVTGSGGGGGTIISSGGTGGPTSGYGPPGQSGPYK